MAKTQSMSFSEFMSGEYKVKEKARKETKSKKSQEIIIKIGQMGAGLALPLALGTPIGAAAILATKAATAAASTTVPAVAPIAVEATAKEWMGEQTVSMLAHALDPVIDILVALSFPIASVIIVGACFFFMLGNPEKAWGMIQNAGLGYVLIQVSPLILNVLKQVGNAV